MISITAVTITNFRCFQSLKLAFEKCHALIGENGTGKTAVLDAIDLATTPTLSPSRFSEQDFNSADAGPIRIVVEFSEAFWVKVPDGYTTQAVPARSVVLVVKRRERAAPGRALSDPFVLEHYARPVPFTDPGELGPIPEGLNCPTSLNETAEGYSVSRKSGKPMKVGTLQLSLRNELVGFPNVFSFDKDRDTQAKIGFNSLLQKIARDLNWRFRAKWNQGEVLTAWNEFYEQVISTVEDAKTGRILRPLQEQIRTLLGRDFSDLELSLLDLEQPFAKTFLARRDGSNQIDQSRLGSGISILVAYLLLDVISGLSKEAIIYLIDEPELHLHPQLQSRLFTRFREATPQTIYTTQSDCFVDVSEWRSILRFGADHVVSPQHAVVESSLEGKRVADHLDEIKPWHQQHLVYHREDNQLFFARRCVLVEGPAERYGLPILAERLGLPLEDVTILSCNGKSKIPYYQLLCKAFGIPYFTLSDLDGLTAEAEENRRPVACAEVHAVHTFASSFEALLGQTRGGKASRTLLAVEDLKKESVPPEITTALTAISAWSRGS